MSNKKTLRTPLHAAHLAAGGKMVPFAGYELPIQYETGVLREHVHTRQSAGLFDVSHMGQAIIVSPDGYDAIARAFETLVTADLVRLPTRQQRYTQLLTDECGILDDLMVSRWPQPDGDDVLQVVVNASRKEVDYAHIVRRLPAGIALQRRNERALLALQGPSAVSVLLEHAPELDDYDFMQVGAVTLAGVPVEVSRSGYTGEDGFEISIASGQAADVWERLASDPRVLPVGLAARDSLRLEAGLCLYGNDIDETTSPVEAALTWSIQKRRRVEGGFPGADRIGREIRDGAQRLRVGITPDGRAPIRRDALIFMDETSAEPVGVVTSGGFGPTVGGPVAMGYVSSAFAGFGITLFASVRGRRLPVLVTSPTFIPHRFKRRKATT